MIPKIIHYCWFGGNPLPNDVKQCINSWKNKCPDYEIKLWDETNFDVNVHPFTKAAYESKSWAFVSDYARLKIVYDNGGIYLDTDVELVKNLDELLEYKSYFGIQQSGHYCNTGLGFGAEKNNEFIKKMLNKYENLEFLEEKKLELACPYLNTEALMDYGYAYSDKEINIDGNLILPPKYLDPIAPGDDLNDLRCVDTISIHHYSASWMGRKTVLRRKFIRFLGQENVSKIKRVLKK